MTLTTLILLSAALAVDVFGIAFAYGLIIRQSRLKTQLQLAGTCGLFQAIMPVIGYFGTASVQSLIAKFDRWLVFGVFVLLGLNIIRNAIWANKEDAKPQKLTLKALLALGIATSIDALVSGSTVYLTQTSLPLAAGIIGLGSFLSGIIGFNLNCCLKHLPEKYLQIFAGIILILLGFKNL